MSGANGSERVVWVLGAGFGAGLGRPTLPQLLSRGSEREIAARYSQEYFPKL